MTLQVRDLEAKLQAKGGEVDQVRQQKGQSEKEMNALKGQVDELQKQVRG